MLTYRIFVFIKPKIIIQIFTIILYHSVLSHEIIVHGSNGLAIISISHELSNSQKFANIVQIEKDILTKTKCTIGHET